MKRLLLLCLVLSGCFTDSGEATRALDNQGFKDIQFSGSDFFACSKGDKTGLSFTATNSNGKRVSGTVCCGVFKSCTIRW
jgi:hypothetical protein